MSAVSNTNSNIFRKCKGAERKFWQSPGVLSTSVGYAGGKLDNPGYRAVCSGMTGHAEVVNVLFDPSKTSYEKMLDVFWDSHNPTTLNQQGNDVGTQYRSVIMYYSDEQKKAAEETKAHFDGLLKAKGRNACVTEIVTAPKYYLAEDYRKFYRTPFVSFNLLLINIVVEMRRSAIPSQESDGILRTWWNWNLCTTSTRRS